MGVGIHSSIVTASLKAVVSAMNAHIAADRRGSGGFVGDGRTVE